MFLFVYAYDINFIDKIIIEHIRIFFYILLSIKIINNIIDSIVEQITHIILLKMETRKNFAGILRWKVK